jgi:LmbE family N-acetylglucosaminyl deacetylase
MPLNNRRVLALMPHPDDCEILCGGTLLRLADQGFEIHVATMTAGDMGSPTLPRAQIAALRLKEAEAGARALGAGGYTCLGFDDVEIVFDSPSRHRVAAVVRQVDPGLVFTTAPGDYMFDHIITSQLVRDAVFNASLPNYATPGGEKPGSGVPYLYYADPIEGKDLFGNRAPVSCVVDISGVIDRKADALAQHASQREWLRAQHGMDDYIEHMKSWAARRGELIGVAYAEGFCQHRGHPHPVDDVLVELLGATPFETAPSGRARIGQWGASRRRG